MSGLTWNRLFAALTPLFAAPPPWPRLTADLIGRLGTWHPALAPAAAACLADLVYAGDAGVRAAGLHALARIVARYPLALGAPTWSWRVQVALAAAGDPRLAPTTRRLLAWGAVLAPAPVARVPAGEAAIWAELTSPVPVDQVA